MPPLVVHYLYPLLYEIKLGVVAAMLRFPLVRFLSLHVKYGFAALRRPEGGSHLPLDVAF